ncbi:MAG: hypothetical protein R3B71_05870 [Candidatus Gracilibacteria bacterium]
MTNFASNRVGIIKNVGDNAITIELPDTGAQIEWPVPEDISLDFEQGESVSVQLKKVMNDVTPPIKQQKDEEEAARKRQLLEQLLN